MSDFYENRIEPHDFPSTLKDKLGRCALMKEIFTAREHTVMKAHAISTPIDWASQKDDIKAGGAFVDANSGDAVQGHTNGSNALTDEPSAVAAIGSEGTGFTGPAGAGDAGTKGNPHPIIKEPMVGVGKYPTAGGR